jgi:hypothetical protein
MATTIRRAFADYASNLEVTDRQETLVSQRRANVVRALRQKLTLHPDEDPKVIGSWDRRTLTRYLSEGDVDVMVVLHHGEHKEWDTADGTVTALNRFRAILDEAYPDTQKRRDRNCITMQFSEFRLDVVPAFKNTGGYYKIPDSVRRQWVKTNPFAFAEKITKVNSAMDGTFVPLIKMVKGWNRDVGWPLRSFHLECLMYRHYRSYTKSYSYSSTLNVFFGKLAEYLAAPCYDPVQGDRVDTYLDEGTARPRSSAVRKARTAAAKASEAYGDEEKYTAVAIDEWKKLLGEFFPAYG